MNIPQLTVAVCTHNRAWILGDALQALLDQTSGLDNFELLVVDNASTDSTAKVAQMFAALFPFFQLVHEPAAGLSHARNTALAAASADWVCFLDDDAKAAPDYVETALQICRQGGFTCFGGAIRPWRRDPLPAWFLDEYESDAWRGLTQVTTLPPGQYVNGGNMIVNKQTVLATGGFDTAYGMCGAATAYGEETELQVRLRMAGHSVGYVPSLMILHYANPEKYTVRKQLEISYKKGIAWQKMLGDASPAALCAIAAKLVASPAKGALISLRRLCNGTYCWQNVLLEVAGRFLLTLGRLRAWLRMRLADKTSR